MGAIASEVRLRQRARRLAYGTLAATLLAAVLLSILVWDVSWWQAVAFGLGPDLAVLYGIAPGLARGQLHPRAVSIHNVAHRFWGPLALAALALGASLPRGYVVGALAWALHVAFDRAIGLRQRGRDGFQRPEGTGPSRPRAGSLPGPAAVGHGQRGGVA